MKSSKRIAEIAIFVAIAAVLEAISTFIPFLHMPQGGSVSVGMLPIFFIAYKYGVKDGLIAGFVFGAINFMYGGFIIHWGSIFFDYIFAFTLIGFAGLFKNALTNDKAFINGIILGGFLRYVMHGISGMIFFAEYAPEGTNAFVYSFVLYNLPYMLASTILCLFVGLNIKDRIFAT